VLLGATAAREGHGPSLIDPARQGQPSRHAELEAFVWDLQVAAEAMGR